MDLQQLTRVNENEWRIEPSGAMRVPAIIYGSEKLILGMDDKVREQLVNVTTLPGIMRAAYAMPDAHWGYGFPIGGVAAFDPQAGGVISAGGVGFDISCGVRSHITNLECGEIMAVQNELADTLFAKVPAGVGSRGGIRLSKAGMAGMLEGGAVWAFNEGYGTARDLTCIEDNGQAPDADHKQISERARKRQQWEMGTLGSGNHYLEVQEIVELHDQDTARTFGLEQGKCLVTIHCGSRGLGHQVGTEYLREMAISAGEYGISLPDRELACAPILSDTGQRYIGAMRAAINCALANRQIIGHLTRKVFERFWPGMELLLLFDVSHNTCNPESHRLNGESKTVWVHRKGATRALGPGNPEVPQHLREAGQPVLIGGSMGTNSWILAGLASSEASSFSSACHGAGRCMSRNQARKRWRGRQLVDDLAGSGIQIRSPSHRGVAEEAPGAYKNVTDVVLATEQAGLAKRVAKLKPVICIKG